MTSPSLKDKMKQKRMKRTTDGNASGTGKGVELFSKKCTQSKKRKDKKQKDSSVADDLSHQVVTASGGLRLESMFVGTLSAEHPTVGPAQERKHVVILYGNHILGKHIALIVP